VSECKTDNVGQYVIMTWIMRQLLQDLNQDEAVDEVHSKVTFFTQEFLREQELTRRWDSERELLRSAPRKLPDSLK